jgi:hypothetical protein
LSISKEELLEGLAIVDQALDIADEFVIWERAKSKIK